MRPINPEHAVCRRNYCPHNTAWRVTYANGVTTEICEACFVNEISDEAGLKEIRRLAKH